MDTVKEILQIFGYQDSGGMDTGESITIGSPVFMDLVIEKIGEQRVSVAHYAKLRSDLMRDPEIVFEIDQSGNWKPIEFTQDPGGYQRNEDGLPGVKDFVKSWNKRLENQGFIREARKQAGADDK